MAAGFWAKAKSFVNSTARKVWNATKKPLEIIGRIAAEAAPVAGAVIGSLVPGVGTAVGGAVGTALGALGKAGFNYLDQKRAEEKQAAQEAVQQQQQQELVDKQKAILDAQLKQIDPNQGQPEAPKFEVQRNTKGEIIQTAIPNPSALSSNMTF